MVSRSETQEAEPSRRAFLVAALYAVGAVSALALFLPSVVRADDDEDDGDDDDSGDDDSEDDNGDDDGDDDGDGGSGGGGGNSGSGDGGSFQPGALDQSDAEHAVRLGKAIPLKQALRHVEDVYAGKVIDVTLRSTGRRLEYRFKVRTDGGAVRTIRMDAGTGKFLGLGALFR